MSAGRHVRGPLLALGVLVLGSLGLELWLRAQSPPPTGATEAAAQAGWGGRAHRRSNLPGLAYELVPGLDRTVFDWHVRTNSLGMRDDEPLQGPDVFRIAAVGDSFTFGYGVSQEETWTHLLERELDRSPASGGRRVDVLSFGVSGYSTQDEVIVLEHRALPLEPDLVILQYCLNDPETRPRQPLHKFFAEEPWWQRSHLLQKVVRRLRLRSYARCGGYLGWLYDRDGENWQAVARNFERIGALCSAREITVVLVLFPAVRPEPFREYRHRGLHAQVFTEGERHGFIPLDMLEIYEREPIDSLALAPDDTHPNARGHELAAEALRDLLVKRGLVGNS